VELLLKLPPGAFRPPPRVRSALVRLRFHSAEPPVKDHATFATLVHAVFTRRRKTLSNALMAFEPNGRAPFPQPAEALARAGIDGKRRPETLTIAEFARLADIYSSAGRPGSDRGPDPRLTPSFGFGFGMSCAIFAAKLYVGWTLLVQLLHPAFVIFRRTQQPDRAAMAAPIDRIDSARSVSADGKRKARYKPRGILCLCALRDPCVRGIH